MCIAANKIYGNPTKLLTITGQFIKNKSLRLTEVLEHPRNQRRRLPSNKIDNQQERVRALCFLAFSSLLII
jgi:hypothetical protein